MDPRHNSHGRSEQPGLEVMEQPGLEVVSQPGLEVIVPYDQSLPEFSPSYSPSDKQTATTAYKSHASELPLQQTESGAPAHRARRKRSWLIVGGVVAVIVILAAVLGGVLGSRAANSSSGASSASQTGADGGDLGNADTPPGDTTTRPQSIRQGSALSVTGWRKPDGSAETYLFFQDPQNGLRYTRCDTSRRSPGNDSACWASPFSFNSHAKAGTRLGASTILWGDIYQPQIELFYTGFKTRLLGVNFNEQTQPNTTDDSVNKFTVYTLLDSSLTAYWPWTIYQHSTGDLYHVRNRVGGRWEPNGDGWDNNPLNITALTASRLAIVPTSTNYSMIAVKAGYAIFYQAPDQRLAVSNTDLNSPQRPSAFRSPWSTTLPDITLPKLAPLAAFSVARKGDAAAQRVDTYVLYLDADANINVLYTDADAAWATAKPDALKGADKDTDIACLNMATSDYNAAKEAVLLEEAGSESRCYFQREGQVVEVRLDAGTGEWVGVGSLPIP